MPEVKPIKDFYKVLEIAPKATEGEIKKAYRKLAFKYHPDTNPTDQYAQEYFRQIQEAYNILSNPTLRIKYDEERWLAGMSNRASEKDAVTPEWVLQEAIKLRSHMYTVDTYRMSHSALNDYIFLLLSNDHMAILKKGEDQSVKEGIISEILKATKGLKYLYMKNVALRLQELAQSNEEQLAMIHNNIRQRERAAKWQKAMPFIVLLIVSALCIAMYFWGG